jgi:hypothetical protein
MWKKTFIIATMFISLILSSCSLQKEKVEPVSSATVQKQQQWIEDIDYLEKNLSEKHVNIYHTITKEEYEKKFSDLKKEVPKLKDYEIKLRLFQIVAAIGDAHTSVQFNPMEYGPMVYPIGVFWFGNELKVLAIDENHKEVIGNNLVAINNIPIKEVVTRINTLISHENEQWLKYNNTKYIQIPEILKFLKVINEDKTEFTFCNDEGKETKLTLTPVVNVKENVTYMKDLLPSKPISGEKTDGNYFDNLYWYKYISEDKIMYFQYNNCIDRNTAQKAGYDNYQDYPDFNKFSEELLKEINEKPIDKLIIDLRYNTGGNSILMSDFVDKLSNISKINDNGKIFVLIGRQTFSSGVMACTDLKDFTKAIFIGESTGGNVNNYGDILYITLPNSKIKISYATKHFNFKPEYKEGFEPDILIEQSFDNYIKGTDATYEAAKSYKN